MVATNKRLLISESHGDSNWCTSCREKPNQHDMYASHASPRTPSVRFLRVVPTRGNLSRVVDRLLPRKRASDTIHSTPADRSASQYPVSLRSQPWSSGGKAKHLSTGAGSNGSVTEPPQKWGVCLPRSHRGILDEARMCKHTQISIQYQIWNSS
jgi:hypothetical protein